jgi:hypothetical protein
MVLEPAVMSMSPPEVAAVDLPEVTVTWPPVPAWPTDSVMPPLTSDVLVGTVGVAEGFVALPVIKLSAPVDFEGVAPVLSTMPPLTPAAVPAEVRMLTLPLLEAEPKPLAILMSPPVPEAGAGVEDSPARRLRAPPLPEKLLPTVMLTEPPLFALEEPLPMLILPVSPTALPVLRTMEPESPAALPAVIAILPLEPGLVFPVAIKTLPLPA